jgi:hypothetical protein
MNFSTPAAQRPVDYKAAARRHLADASVLMHAESEPNAGQLLGFSVECGLKALLVATGASVDQDGNILKVSGFREHLPKLATLISAIATLPDGRLLGSFQAQMPSLAALQDWHVDHRYWRESALPLASLPAWERAAREVDAMLDQATADGVLR